MFPAAGGKKAVLKNFGFKQVVDSCLELQLRSNTVMKFSFCPPEGSSADINLDVM